MDKRIFLDDKLNQILEVINEVRKIQDNHTKRFEDINKSISYINKDIRNSITQDIKKIQYSSYL